MARLLLLPVSVQAKEEDRSEDAALIGFLPRAVFPEEGFVPEIIPRTSR